jgi:hypothetical protein
VAAALGSSVDVLRVERLRGGSKKAVFRLMLAGHASVVLYVGDDSENCWSTVGEVGTRSRPRCLPHADSATVVSPRIAAAAADHRIIRRTARTAA